MHLSSVMNYCFGLIFLILDVVSIQSVDGSSKINSNKYGNPFLSNSFTSQASNVPSSNNNYYPYLKSMNNPLFNRIRTYRSIKSEFSNISKPNTQSLYTSQPNYTTSERNITIFSTPGLVNNNITKRSTHTLHQISNSSSPSLEDLISFKMSPMKSISELKCDEYIREIAGTMSQNGSSSACENTNRLTIDGNDTQVGEIPHMVALGRIFSFEFEVKCGGALISHTWVLTAAQCTYVGPDWISHAKIGSPRVSGQDGFIIAIKNMINHPDYKPPVYYADIALVQLMNDVTFSTSIRPACLYQQYDTVPRNVWTSGWGSIDLSHAPLYSDLLHKIELYVIDNLFCARQYNNVSSEGIPYGITPSLICAGHPRSNWSVDTCHGDGGGPLYAVHPKSECFFEVIGITSFGSAGCATIDIPGVYTRVSYYLSWIEDIVWPQEQGDIVWPQD